MSDLDKKLEELITRVHAVSDNFSAYLLSFERDLLEDALRAALREACAAQREEDAKVCYEWGFRRLRENRSPSVVMPETDEKVIRANAEATVLLQAAAAIRATR